MRSDWRQRPVPCRGRVLIATAVVLFTLVLAAPAIAQERPGAARDAAQVSGEPAAEAEHSEGVLPLVAKIVNFAALAWILTYFLKSPLLGYLDSRGDEIRQDLVAASEMRRAATAQLAEIEQKLKALPGELEALKTRGTEDLRAEQARIAQAVAAERERLLEQTRREIEMRLRVARRDLIEYAAQLAVDVAGQRVKRAITPEDHLRLVDRYTTQVENAR